MSNPEVITFYGTDGCGKSSIARNLSVIMSGEGKDNILIGSGSYTDWLDEDVSRLVFGDPEHILALEEDGSDKTVLYGDIAVACYGLALSLKQEGVSTIIDSDPLLKRMIWSTFECSPEEHFNYANNLNQKLTRYVGPSFGPDTIVAINQAKDSSVSASELVKRILSRGNPSYDDPTHEEAMVRLMGVVSTIWDEIESACEEGSSSYPIFTDRLNQKRIIHVCNPECICAEDIKVATATVAEEILDKMQKPKIAKV